MYLLRTHTQPHWNILLPQWGTCKYLQIKYPLFHYTLGWSPAADTTLLARKGCLWYPWHQQEKNKHVFVVSRPVYVLLSSFLWELQLSFSVEWFCVPLVPSSARRGTTSLRCYALQELFPVWKLQLAASYTFVSKYTYNYISVDKVMRGESLSGTGLCFAIIELNGFAAEMSSSEPWRDS